MKFHLPLAALLLLALLPVPSAAGNGNGARPAASAEAAIPAPDRSLREGWRLLSLGKSAMSRDKFRKIDPAGYELADYVVAFTGMSWAKEGKLAEASAAYDNLLAAWPRSPLVPLLATDLAFLAAKGDNLALSKSWHEVGRGKVQSPERKAEEAYVAARLLEESDPAAAAEAHIRNFAAWSAQEGGTLSFERLSAWHREGRFSRLGLPIGSWSSLAKASFRAGETALARQLYREALRRFPRSEESVAVMHDFAELLRKEGDTRAAGALLEQAVSGSPAGRCSDAAFLMERVKWRAGDLAGARKGFEGIAANPLCRPATAEKALYLAAWIAEEEGDLPFLTEAFGKLRTAGDETIRQEAVFRHAFGLYRAQLFDNAAAAFRAGERAAHGTVERARHRFWKARALEGLGRDGEADAEYRATGSDPNAGVFALFSLRRLGRDPYALFSAPSSMETRGCSIERARLWERIRQAGWGPEEAAILSRSERLSKAGLLEYAVLEADRIDRSRVRKVFGLADGGTAGFFRYLVGDLRGGLREADRLPTDPVNVGILEKIQFPLAPELTGDCDRRKSGMDPLVLHSVIRQESQFSPTILSPAGAVGLMQLMPRTAAETARRAGRPRPKRGELTDPQLNVELGAAYLARLVRTFGGDYLRAVAAYNAGESAAAKWWRRSGGDPALFLENISYRETRGYVRRVFFNLLQYYRIYRPKMLARHLASAPPEAPPAPGAPGTPPTGGTDAGGGEPPSPAPPGGGGGTTPQPAP